MQNIPSKKKTFLLILISTGTLFTGFAQSFGPGKDTISFIFTLRTPSIKALDSYPQTIDEIAKVDNDYQITLTTTNPYLDKERTKTIKNVVYVSSHIYSGEVARYLNSTSLIDANNKVVKHIADTLLHNEDNLFSLINKALKFTSTFLTYDESLAMQIDVGICRTLDVAAIINGRKGTCSEYTNLFISLMRYKNIPTRFAVGYIYMPEQNQTGTHAWAECYIEDVGWCAVDPQMGNFFFPHVYAIKMRHGLDFEDCDIRTLALDIDPVEIGILKKTE